MQSIMATTDGGHTGIAIIPILIISVLIQRFNASLLHESFADENRSDD